MRLKHVKGAGIKIENSKYIVLNYNCYKGIWKKAFNNNNPIHIEIGMGKGDFLIGMAMKYPNINFIGIEKYDSVIVRAIEKLDNYELPNIRLIRMDASKIEDVFSSEIDVIYLNFSDPWPKKRHEHRRLTSKNFLEKYDNLFKENHHIIQKTDNRNLFEFSLMSFVNNEYKINDISLDLHNSGYIENIETEYEHKFASVGNPIYMVDVQK